MGRIEPDYDRECPECPMHYSSYIFLLRKKNIKCLFRRDMHLIESNSTFTKIKPHHFVSLNLECVKSTSFTTTEQTDTTVDYQLSSTAATTVMPNKDSSQTKDDISRYVERFIDHHFKSLNSMFV